MADFPIRITINPDEVASVFDRVEDLMPGWGFPFKRVRSLQVHYFIEGDDDHKVVQLVRSEDPS